MNLEQPPQDTACSFCQKVGTGHTLLFKGKTPNVWICYLCAHDCVSLCLKRYPTLPGGEQLLHYRYRWRGRYADGSDYPQFDERGVERSVGRLEWDRVVGIDLEPRLVGFPPVSLIVRPDQGEKAIKFWQKTVSADDGSFRESREVLGIQKGEHKFFGLFGADGKIVLSSTDNV